MKTKCIINKIRNISLFSDKFLDKKIKEFNLPILRNHIPLFYILPYGEEKMLFNELSKNWKISKSSLSDIITRYENLGIVEKCNCNDDKRTIYLSLTEKALPIKETLDSFDKEFLDLLLKGFDSEDKNNFEEYIEKALENSKRI